MLPRAVWQVGSGGLFWKKKGRRKVEGFSVRWGAF